MKSRLFKVNGSKGSENTGDWVVPVERADSELEQYELQAVETFGSATSPPTWSSLFSFTTKGNWIAILTSGTGTLLAGVMKPASAIFFGNIFSVLSKYGAGNLTAQAALHQISIWCISLVALGVAAWIAEGVSSQPG